MIEIPGPPVGDPPLLPLPNEDPAPGSPEIDDPNQQEQEPEKQEPPPAPEPVKTRL